MSGRREEDRSWDEIEKGISYSLVGRQSDMALGVEFLGEVDADLKNLGFKDADELGDAVPITESLSPALEPQPVTADVVVVPAVVSISLFLGATLGQWAIGKVLDEVVFPKIRPKFERWLGRVEQKEEKDLMRPTVYSFGILYGPDRVLVRVLAEAYSSEELERSEPLVREAHKLALRWVEENGTPHDTVLTYRIKDGELVTSPTIGPTTKVEPAVVECSVGQSVRVGLWDVTLNEVERGYASSVASVEPTAGQEFVRVNVTVRNRADRDIPLTSYYFTSHDSDGGHHITQSFAAGETDLSRGIRRGRLGPGKSVTGDLVFELPMGDDARMVFQPVRSEFMETTVMELKLPAA